MICKTKINKQDIKCIDDINEFYECENYCISKGANSARTVRLF